MSRKFVGEPFSVSLISGAEKVWIREGGLSRFSVEKYLSHSAENFRGWRESFSVSFILGIDKVWTRGGGGRQYQDFPSKIFCLTVPKDFLREPFRVSLISGMENFFASEGYVTILDFLSKFYCLTVPRNFVGKPLSVSLLSGAKEVWINEGVGSIKIFCPKISFSQCRKFS